MQKLKKEEDLSLSYLISNTASSLFVGWLFSPPAVFVHPSVNA